MDSKKQTSILLKFIVSRRPWNDIEALRSNIIGSQRSVYDVPKQQPKRIQRFYRKFDVVPENKQQNLEIKWSITKPNQTDTEYNHFTGSFPSNFHYVACRLKFNSEFSLWLSNTNILYDYVLGLTASDSRITIIRNIFLDLF